MSDPNETWRETNQRLLAAELARVRELLETQGDGGDGPQDGAAVPPALEHLCQTFQLSAFERDLLLLCAGMELDSAFAVACASAHGDPVRAYPSFGLALAVLPGAHWSALSPSSPLRHWRLIEPAPGELLTTAWLRIDETVLHFLTGVLSLDERLEGIVEPVASADRLAPSQQVVATRLADAWSSDEETADVLLHLSGHDVVTRRAVTAGAASEAKIGLCLLRAADLPAGPAERTTLALLWERQALLGPSALLIECDDFDAAEVGRLALSLAEQIGSPVVLAGQEPPPTTLPLIRLEVETPTSAEQELLWREVLEPASLNGALDRVVAQFDLGVTEIKAAGAEARARDRGGAAVGEALWEACRVQVRPQLNELAQRVEAVGSWDDLVLPESEWRMLRDLILQVRHRDLVQRQWGFASKSSRGLGVSALFVGPSGTGKTMAAEVLARELRLDLFRIDLSAVVSKYIGETEKNLRRVFDAAEHGGAILLFDEADALFGKRSEVRDSHDRYANIEVGYLLQRMEAYCGLAILTTNLKGALDTAFLRRIRTVVQFPRPDAAARCEIWRRVFPEAAPVGELNLEALAGLDVSGGAIRNIALRGAFLAAEADTPVGMEHLADAARSECAKLERPIGAAEIGGWT